MDARGATLPCVGFGLGLNGLTNKATAAFTHGYGTEDTLDEPRPMTPTAENKCLLRKWI